MAGRKANAVTIKLDSDQWGKLVEYRDNHFFESNGIAARHIVVAALDDPDAAPSTPPDERARKRQLENQLLENKLAKDRGEWIPIDEAFDIFLKAAADLKTIVSQLPNAIPGLTDEQRANAQDVIDRTFGDLKSAFEKLGPANDAEADFN